MATERGGNIVEVDEILGGLPADWRAPGKGTLQPGVYSTANAMGIVILDDIGLKMLCFTVSTWI